MAFHSKIHHSPVNYAGDQVCGAQFDVSRSWYWSESVLILQEVWKFRVLRVLSLCRPSLLVVSLVTEERNMSHFITQFCLECRIHQTRLATLWTDPNSVLPSLAGILNHWLKSELSVKNLPRLLQPLSPNDPFSITQYSKQGQFPPRDPICSSTNVTFLRVWKIYKLANFAT